MILKCRFSFVPPAEKRRLYYGDIRMCSVVEPVTKIIFGINVPYQSTKIDWGATRERLTPCNGIAKLPIRIPHIRYKEMSFMLCDICGSQVSPGRAARGITTCTPKCNAKKWDVINGLVIERERNANGVRPTSFWNTISSDCFTRDKNTCRHCKKTREQLKQDKISEHWIGDKITGKRNPGWKPTNYILNCHHIKPIKDGGNNQLSNLITLCGKCHKIEHSHTKNVVRKQKLLNNQLVV